VKERLVTCNEEDDLHDVITGVVRSGTYMYDGFDFFNGKIVRTFSD